MRMPKRGFNNPSALKFARYQSKLALAALGAESTRTYSSTAAGSIA